MKKVPIYLFAIVMLAMASCKSMLQQFTQKTYVLDYSKASKQGVFLTEANSVSFEYTPIASIVVTSTDGMAKVAKATKSYGDDSYGGSDTKISYKDEWQVATYEQTLDRAVQSCIDLGGDGIINITFNLNHDSQGGVTGNTLRGMVIRRK
jgi:hypothetical protein